MQTESRRNVSISSGTFFAVDYRRRIQMYSKFYFKIDLLEYALDFHWCSHPLCKLHKFLFKKKANGRFIELIRSVPISKDSGGASICVSRTT